MVEDGKKVCPRCNRNKKIHLFAKNIANGDGLQAYCKSCHSKIRKEYFSSLSEKDKLKKKAISYRNNWLQRAKKIDKISDPELQRPTYERQVPTTKEIHSWLEQQKPFRCYVSGNYIAESEIQVDHVIPIARGGTFNFDNLKIISKKWNRIKGSLTDTELFDLLAVILKWEDKGDAILKRLSQANY